MRTKVLATATQTPHYIVTNSEVEYIFVRTWTYPRKINILQIILKLMLLTNVLMPTAIKRIEAEIRATLPRIVDFIYSSQANFCITSADKRMLVLILIPSFFARAKLTTGSPLTEGFMA